jgi:hypothetical protein
MFRKLALYQLPFSTALSYKVSNSTTGMARHLCTWNPSSFPLYLRQLSI